MLPLRQLLWLVALGLIAGVLLAAYSDHADAATPKPPMNHCISLDIQQPKTFICDFFKRRSIRVRVNTTGTQDLKWSMKCDFIGITVHNRLPFPPQRNYDIWFNADTEPLVFDQMSFDTCHLFVRIWLTAGADASASLSVRSKRSYLP